MLQQCMNFCIEHDDQLKVKTLDFSQCYVGYVMEFTDGKIYTREYMPYDMTETKHVLSMGGFDCSEHSFSRMYFRLTYNERDEYYFLTKAAIKTAHLRLNIPRQPCNESAMMTAKNIDILNIGCYAIICKQKNAIAYDIYGVFHKYQRQPWHSWNETIKYFMHNKIINWYYSVNEGFVAIFELSGDLSTSFKGSPLKPFYGLQLDGTGHVSDKMIGGFYLDGEPATAFVVLSVIFADIGEDLQLRQYINYAYSEVCEYLFQLMECLEVEKHRILSADQFVLYSQDFYLHDNKLSRIIGKKFIRKILENVNSGESMLDVKLNSLHAIAGGINPSEFFWAGGKYIFEMFYSGGEWMHFQPGIR